MVLMNEKAKKYTYNFGYNIQMKGIKDEILNN